MVGGFLWFAYKVRDTYPNLVTDALGGFIGMALFALVVTVIVAWIVFPIFVASYLRQIRDSVRELVEQKRLDQK